MGFGASFFSKVKSIVVEIVVPNILIPKAAQFPSKTNRLINKKQTHKKQTQQRLPVPNNTIPKTHNPTTQLNSTKTKPGPNRTHSQPRKRIVTQTEPDNTTENNNKGEDDTITGTPSSQEVDFPQSPYLVSELTRNNPSIHPSAKNRELNDKIQKSMVKIRANHTGTPRRRTKQIEPRRIVPWRT